MAGNGMGTFGFGKRMKAMRIGSPASDVTHIGAREPSSCATSPGRSTWRSSPMPLDGADESVDVTL